MITQEAFKKFLEDIERQLKEVDKINKLKAENTLNAVDESYRQKVSARVAIELTAAEECRKIGDDAGVRHRTVLADICRSLFNIHDTK